jgi:hypothetical protein
MENYDDQLSRLNLMADDDGTSWDLSENDQAAISAVIDKLSSVEDERDALAGLVGELRGALEEIDEYEGGADSVLADEYVTERRRAALALPLPAATERVAEWKEKAEEYDKLLKNPEIRAAIYPMAVAAFRAARGAQ